MVALGSGGASGSVGVMGMVCIPPISFIGSCDSYWKASRILAISIGLGWSPSIKTVLRPESVNTCIDPITDLFVDREHFFHE